MKRTRPIPHLFTDLLTDEKKRLEAQLAKLKPGPEREQIF